LLATRSAFRGQLEGTPVNPGDQPNPPIQPSDVIARAKANLPPGITAQDIDSVFLDDLFVPPSPTGGAPAPGQIGNVSTDIATIMIALDIGYDPNKPNCPKGSEIAPLTQAILGAIQA
jgi:hypothetical protein